MLSGSRILSIFTLITLSGSISAKCLPTADAYPDCRYPPGDSWCAEKERSNPYAYSDKCLASVGSKVSPVEPIYFWNTNRLWAGQGACSAIFFFDSGDGQEIENLQVTFSAIDQSGDNVTTGTLEVENFGGSSADRYTQAFAEGERFCDDDLTIVINHATAKIDNREIDLLERKSLIAKDFKPFKIFTKDQYSPVVENQGATIEGKIDSYDCGDNCYLTIIDQNGKERSGLCTSESFCQEWNEKAEMPDSFKGKAVKAIIGSGVQYDGEGNVMGSMAAFEHIELIQ